MSVMDSLDKYRQEREFEIVQTSELQRERLINLQELQASAGSRAASATEDVAVEISRMAAIADWSLPAIVEHLALTAERLGGIEQMLASPTETAAAEFYRRGSYALSSGWLEEAEVDLSAAVDAYPYNPRTWFNLGIARQRAGFGDTAVEAYSRCARYGASADPELTARAVLLSGFLYRSAGRPEESREILQEYADRLDGCAELHVALSVHHGDHEHLVRALVLAPEMAADARSAGVARLDDAAEAVCQMPTGPVHRLHTLEQIAGQLAETARAEDMELSASACPSPRNLPSGRADGLLQAYQALPSALEVITVLAAEIHGGYQARLAAAAAAVQALGKARTQESETALRAQEMEEWADALAADVLRAIGDSVMEARRVAQAVECTTRAREQATHEVALAERRSADAVSATARAGEYARAQDPWADQTAAARDEALAEWRLAIESKRAATEPAHGVGWSALDEPPRSVPLLPEPSDHSMRVLEEAAEKATERAAEADRVAKQAWRVGNEAARAQRDANEALGEAKLQEYQAFQDEQAAAQAFRERGHVAPIEQLWQQAGEELAEFLPDDGAARRHLVDVRERLDADHREGDDRIDALRRDLLESIVQPARHLALEARNRSLVANRVAEEAQVRVSRAAQLESAAQSGLETARQTAAPPERIIPFDLPDQWTA